MHFPYWLIWIILIWITYRAASGKTTLPRPKKGIDMLNPTRTIPNDMSVKNIRRYLQETEDLIEKLSLTNKSNAGKAFIAMREQLKEALETTEENQVEAPERQAENDGQGRTTFKFGNTPLICGFNDKTQRYEVYTRKGTFVAHSYNNRFKAMSASRHRLTEWSDKKRQGESPKSEAA